MDKTAAVVVAHGSRRESCVGSELQRTIDAVRRRLPGVEVNWAALQFNMPNLKKAVEEAVEGGATRVIVVPMFLFQGNHVFQDIPGELDELRERFPDVEIICTGHIGPDQRVADILTERIQGVTGRIYGAGGFFVHDPLEIEHRSFDIIEELLPGLDMNLEEKSVVKRVVHTTGDPSIAEAVYISQGAIEAGRQALRAGGDVFCDVNMVRSGIKASILTRYGGRALSLIDDPSVAESARSLHTTRSAAAVIEGAARNGFDGEVVAIGNAPTALFTLIDLVQKGRARPALVVGVPVGFVGARESKEALEQSGLPCITVRGTRGGSNVAAAIVNALLLLL